MPMFGYKSRLYSKLNEKLMEALTSVVPVCFRRSCSVR